MIRKLIYIPNGIMVPEIHVMLSLTQNLIDDKKNKVRIITCGGDKDFACSKNVFAIKEICKADVPLIQAIAYFEFVNFFTSSSNNSTYFPAVDTHEVFKQSLT